MSLRLNNKSKERIITANKNREHEEQLYNNNYKAEMRKQTTVSIFQAIEYCNLTSEDVDVVK